jgi:hypothetical protein
MNDLKVELQHKGLPYFGSQKRGNYYGFRPDREKKFASKIIISFRPDNRSAYQKGHVWGARYQKRSPLTPDWKYNYSSSEHRIQNDESITLAIARTINEFIKAGWRITSVPTKEADIFLGKIRNDGEAEQRDIHRAEKKAQKEHKENEDQERDELLSLIDQHGKVQVERIATLWGKHRWRVEREG